MADKYKALAEKILRDAVEGIENLTIAEMADEHDLDYEELEKRVRGAKFYVTVPTKSGCTCTGLDHRRGCPDWRMCL